VSPTPLTRKRVLLPSFGSKWETHFDCGGGFGGPNSDEGIHTLVLYAYAISPLRSEGMERNHSIGKPHRPPLDAAKAGRTHLTSKIAKKRDIAKPYALNAKQLSCAEVNSPYKGKYYKLFFINHYSEISVHIH
jgi:hypothetical protein